ncbi:5-carboxymethyl-2-hydroxymuconate Delta-isomerase [Streptomyces sp. NBC_01218]|uniref:5-carboxymethyl-2-hydroxymuconate Delta-isomerase n=1 Tax=unclassified Streptomyces TaxID=2593676 RepID=UPI0023B995B6|nr:MULTISPECIES: 5-carboxymethyl-2-hydroxymuconate Delta-isomerase [unclassified Streptomyces]WEH42171.1 5-carboxymethyl-2-hydroxymuconate Delta-isomerase [Streptomyces sp. AM 2-1-1]WSQ53792.1 5-carboxymethyl-2-hydroxymuconate Delta-isomerase [Streptomyces sp. NBC_01218]
MPHITIDYSADLDDAFDRRGFAAELHPLVARTISTSAAACKTRLRRVGETLVGEEAADTPLVHITVALMPGRTPEVRALLTESVLALLAEHLKPADGIRVETSVETREIDPSYRKS